MARPEQRLQMACASHLRRVLHPGIFWTARDLATASAYEGETKKAMGCKPGLSDIEIWLLGPQRRLHLELKAVKSREAAWNALSDTQRAMIPIIASYGEIFEVIWSVRSLEEVLTRHRVPWQQPALHPTGEQRDIALAGWEARAKAKAKEEPALGRKKSRRGSASRLRRASAIRQRVMF